MTGKPCHECGCLPSDTWGCNTCTNEDCPCSEAEEDEDEEQMTDTGHGPLDVTRPDPDATDDAAAVMASAGCLTRAEIRNGHGEDCGGSLICVFDVDHDGTAKSPGQVAYEAEAEFWAGGFLGEIRVYLPWDKLPPGDRHSYAAAARAVLASMHYDATDEIWWRPANGDQPETHG